MHGKIIRKDKENESVRIVEWRQPGRERYRREENRGGIIKFRGVKERVTATQTLHTAW